jgi:SAM-dependent methyltransferase
MSFSQEWNERYQSCTHLSIWPWSDLVSQVMRYCRPDRPGYRVLELGCGAGANIPFLTSLGVDYHAVDGSEEIVGKLWERFPQLRNRIAVGDFTREIPFAGPFDLVVDRASLTHNSTRAIMDAMALLRSRLRPGSKFVGIDWFSTEHADYQQGEQADDLYTRRNIVKGSFAGVGRVHFSDRAHLEQLFSGFKFESLEHKTIRQETPAGNGHSAAFWNFVAALPELTDCGSGSIEVKGAVHG